MATEPRARLNPPVSDRDHTQGPDDSSVTLVEYGDYECPYCGQAENSVHEIQERTGNAVRLVFRHFPNRSVHPHARLAAEASEAAGAQGKFWEMHDLLFQHQDHLEEWDMLEYARELDLDIDQFQKDIDEHTYADKVREDFRSGLKSGVQGTPTWFINEERYDGAWDPDSLLEAVRRPMRVRISAMDNPNNSKDEGGIDAVSIYELSCESTPPGDFDDDGDVDWDDFFDFFGIYLNRASVSRIVCSRHAFETEPKLREKGHTSTSIYRQKNV